MGRFGLVPFTRCSVKGGIFRFRLQLPADVFARLAAAEVANARRTVSFSLKTRDPLTARSRALRAAADVSDMISAIRSGSIPSWQFAPTMYQQDRIIVPSSGQKPVVSKRAGAGVAKPQKNAMTLHRVYKEVYLPRREDRKGAPPRRRARLDMEKAIALFVASSNDLAITSISRKEAEKFVRGLEVGSIGTKKKIVIALSTVCNAAVAADLIPANPFRGLGPDRSAIAAARRSYSRLDHDQLARFFGRTEREDGAVLWLPRLLLLTGARLEEMAQLRSEWFVRRDGVDVIDLHDAQVKSAHNRRYIPLHRDLLDLGILDLVSRSPDRLFPELRYRPSAERWSGAISMKLNRTIDEALGRDRRLTVHSLRKTFEHAAYVIGVPKPSINAITGHKPGDVSEEHYLMLKDDVALLKRHLDQIDFPFLKQVCSPIAA